MPQVSKAPNMIAEQGGMVADSVGFVWLAQGWKVRLSTEVRMDNHSLD